jgi:spermidine synthase
MSLVVGSRTIGAAAFRRPPAARRPAGESNRHIDPRRLRRVSASQDHPNGPGPQSPRYLPALLLLFVGSGCAALIYEIVWYQMLQLVVGLTTVSLGVLLGTFMGGMCLGSLLLARLVSAGRHPLRVYAALELGIAVCGLLLLAGFPYLAQVYTNHFGYGLSGVTLRVAIAVVCLIPPTLLMGATLPAIARWVESTPQGVSWLGFFYGGNIAGAVFGCLLAGFYLLRVHDIAYATYVAATVNAAVAALAIGLSAVSPHRAAGPAPAPARSAESPQRATHARAVYIAIALSGLSALGAEVVWTRQLSLVLGGTVYTFAIILAVFLAGLGVGSSVGSLLARVARRPQLMLGACQVLLMLGIGWTAYMIARSLPYWPIDPSISTDPWYTFQSDMARTFWAIFPATLLWGASFPLALAAAAAPGQDPGRLVGGVYAANTVGAILGALGLSMIFIPWIGTQNSQRLLIAVAAVSAIVMFAPLMFPAAAKTAPSAPGGGPQPLMVRFSGVSLVILIVVGAFLLARGIQAAPWGIIAYGRYMATYGDQLEPGVRDTPPAGANKIWCLYEGEGLNGSVVVTESSYGVRSFHSAGRPPTTRWT